MMNYVGIIIALSTCIVALILWQTYAFKMYNRLLSKSIASIENDRKKNTELLVFCLSKIRDEAVDKEDYITAHRANLLLVELANKK